MNVVKNFAGVVHCHHGSEGLVLFANVHTIPEPLCFLFTSTLSCHIYLMLVLFTYIIIA